MQKMGTFMDFVNKYILYEVLIMMWLQLAWKSYLKLRQRRLEKSLVDLPKSVEGMMTKETYDKARLYALDNGVFDIFDDWYQMFFSTIFLCFIMYHFWEWSVSLAAAMGFNSENEILISAICAFIIQTANEIIELPLKIYDTFILEAKHGFNKQTPMFFVKDKILMYIVTQLISIPIICAMIWIIKNGGDYFFLCLWIFSVLVILFLMIIYPGVIAPLFDKYSPLPDGELKDKINELAASLNFPLYKLFIVEGSKRSSHSNAYLYGFFKHKRIVLFDTLCKEYYKPDEKDQDTDKGCDTEEILAVLSHELGHWRHSHTLKSFMFTQVLLLMVFFSFVLLLNYTPMYVAFGFTNSKPVYIGIIIISMYIFQPINTVVSYLGVWISRKFEFQADRFAAELGRGEALKSALLKLQKDNLSFPLFDKLYSSWFHQHPPILERLEALKKDI